MKKSTPTIILFLQKTLVVICLIFLIVGCSPPSCRAWVIEEIKTRTPCFNSARLLLAPDGPNSHLELEIVGNQSGVRVYLNILFLKAPFTCQKSQSTTIKVCFEDREPWEISVYLLKGQQRLLFPQEIQEVLIQALLEGETFTLMLGNSSILVISDQFSALYDTFLRNCNL